MGETETLSVTVAMRESAGSNRDASVGSQEKKKILSEPRVRAVINKANCKEATQEEMFEAVNCGGAVTALDENF